MKNQYGALQQSGEENNLEWSVYLDNNFKFTIVVENKISHEINTATHQGVNAIFGMDYIDIQEVNSILDRLITKMSC